MSICPVCASALMEPETVSNGEGESKTETQVFPCTYSTGAHYSAPNKFGGLTYDHTLTEQKRADRKKAAEEAQKKAEALPAKKATK